MPVILTPIRELVSSNPGSGTWNPMSGPIPTAGIRQFRLTVWFGSDPTGIAMAPGVQFSNDGVTWDSLQRVVQYPDPNYWFSGATAGWNYTPGLYVWTTYHNLFDLPSPKLFVRFGAQIRNYQNTDYRGVLARYRIQTRPVVSRVEEFGPQVAYTKGSTTNQVFVPYSGWLPAEAAGQVRLATEILSISGTPSVQGGYQLADDPKLVSNWATPVAITELSATTTGHHYMGDFATAGAPYGTNFVRYGLMVKEAGSDTRSAARATLRLEYRE